jgi:hypothetical protein
MNFIKIDNAIRIASLISVSILGTAMLLLVSIMATDSGTDEAYSSSLVLFLSGATVIFVIIFLSLYPDKIAKYIPGPVLLGKIIVRVPIYLCGTIGFFMFLRQIWQVAIPDIFG